MPHGRPSVGRLSYVRFKFRQDTLASWVELKASLELPESNNAGVGLNLLLNFRLLAIRLQWNHEQQ